MCGRFTLIHDIQSIAKAFNASVPASLQLAPRYNIAPTQDIVTVLREKPEEQAQLALLRWGLIPSWAKEESIGSRMINARAETLAEKASFKRLLNSRRCLVVADGFYEWAQEPGAKAKTPMYIKLNNGEPFAFAGLWDSWKDPHGEQVRTCTIITTEPNELMARMHNRMPVILPPQAREEWLDPTNRDLPLLTHLLSAYPAAEMQARPVSRLVNDPKHDGAELIA
ncbi:MAG: SOS response-associated peptidase [Ktedonobacteraceae bacterium]